MGFQLVPDANRQSEAERNTTEGQIWIFQMGFIQYIAQDESNAGQRIPHSQHVKKKKKR